MTPFAHLTRPVGVATVHQVEGRLWQARCVCRWHGRRVALRETADTDAANHALACGLCIHRGRAFMDRCSCMPCQRRRAVRERWGMPPETALRQPVPMGRTCRDHSPETETSSSKPST